VTKRGDTKLLQVLVRQARENRLVYVILTEDRLVLREAQAPQPTSNIHDGRPNPMGQRNLGLGETACPGPLWVTSRHFDAARLMSALTTSGHTAGRRTALCGSGTAVGFGGDGAVQGAATRTAGPSASRRVGLWVISGAGPARHRAARTRGRFLLRAVEAAVTQSIA